MYLMKKILIVGIIIIFVTASFVQINFAQDLESTFSRVIGSNLMKNLDGHQSADIETKKINVALVAQSLLIGSGYGAFVNELDGYSWIVGNTQYILSIHQITDKDIYKGELTTENYDLLLMPGGGGGGHSIWTKSRLNSPLVKIWRKNIIDFIKDGGGYYGVCGGTYFILGLDRPPHSVNEIAFDRSSLGVSCVNLSFISYANPIFCQFAGLGPEAVGEIAYMFYSGYDWEFCQIYAMGLCLDVPVNRNHPIFSDYLDDTARIRWVGGPGYSISDNPGREISILARFQEEEISDNETMRIHVWKYTGGIRGLVKGTLEHIKKDGSLFNDFSHCLFRASDWEMTDEIMKTNFSNKPFMTAEVYPNENQARIYLCSGHPEMTVWWGGHMAEAEDTDDNSIYNGLSGWINRTPRDETPQDEGLHNRWMARRAVAWAAKVPDDDLPPTYGPSQVSDICPYEQPSSFNIQGNSEIPGGIDGEVLLYLYYRYSMDNTSWGSWTFYETDKDKTDGWSWNFDVSTADGAGYYQFYSLRTLEYEGHVEIEKVPPGADAIAHIG